MSPEITEPLFATCATVAAVALGGTLAVLATHRLNIDRERIGGITQRKRAFLAFLSSWKHEIGRTYMHPGGGGFEHHESAFKDVLSSFIYEAGMIRWDFPTAKRKEFDALCEKLIGWKHRSVYGTELNDKAKKDMDDLIAFVEAI